MAYIGLTNILTKVGGIELTLDLDEDTSLTADTDDQIDVRIAGADDFQFTANTFSVLTGSSQKFADSAKGLFGTGDDLEIYHDGTNSYIANKTGALKVATETSGIVVTIGHTTSETTIADNLTVTGNASIGGNLDVTGSFDMSDADITNIGSIALDSITNDGTDITLDSSNDIVIDAAGGNVEFKDAGTLQLTLDMDGTSGAQVIQLGVDSDDLVFNQYDGNEVMRIADDRAVYFFDKGGEKISSDGTDLTINAGADLNLTAVTDINIPANVGLTFGNDAEKIEGDGTDLTIAGNNINLTATADVNIPSGVGITFATAEKIESDGTDLSITVGSGGDINIPANIGLTFGDDGEKIEGDGTDLTIAGNNINLTATADVVVPANVGVTFGTGEKIEGDNTDLTVTSGAKINLTATSDVHLPNNVGMVFGDSAEKIEGDGTDLTITGNNIKLTAATDVIIPTNIGLHFTDANEKIESDGSKLTLTSGGTAFALPTSDGSNGEALVTNGSGVLSFAAAGSSNPSSADGEALGSASLEWSDLFLADGGTIQFGNDQEVRLIHTADTGLILKHTATADDKPVSLTLQTGETDIAANDVIGKIDFQAPDEGTGTDAILVAAGIEAVSEGDFSSSNNATKLSFKTGVSEAASEKMSLSSAGLLTIADDLVIKDGGTIGVASDADSITIASDGVVTFSQVPVLPDNTVATADIQADAITGAKIADNAINSEHYTDGSIDTAHIGDTQVTLAKIAGSGTRNSTTFLRGDGAFATAGSTVSFSASATAFAGTVNGSTTTHTHACNCNC